jgi:hypothetical protein
MPALPRAKLSGFSFIELLLAVLAIVCLFAFFLRNFSTVSQRAKSPAVSILFHYRVFETDASLVDQMIPTNDRHNGIQPNVQSTFLRGHVITPVKETKSQIARVSPAVINTLLQGIAAKPGLLVDQSRLVTSDWWEPGLADCWTYGIADDTFLGGGSGTAFFGARQRNGVTDVQIACLLGHSVDSLGNGAHANVFSRILYEGPLPKTDALAFLVPFLRHDGSPHYLVTVFDFNGQTNRSLALESEHVGLSTH